MLSIVRKFFEKKIYWCKTLIFYCKGTTGLALENYIYNKTTRSCDYPNPTFSASCTPFQQIDICLKAGFYCNPYTSSCKKYAGDQ